MIPLMWPFTHPAGQSQDRAQVVIIGGGFGGLSAARALRRADCDITLIDRRNHYLFQPLLYQVATAVLSPADIAQPIRSLLRRQPNCTVVLGEAREIDRERRKVLLDAGELDYDHLVVAAGARTSYFGHDEWAEVAPGLKTVEDALDIRRRVLLAFERAERCSDPVERQAWLTFIVVGGGPTGVELAGALSDIARLAMERDFRRIDPSQARIILVEGDQRVLGTMHEKMSRRAAEQLAEIGVELIFGQLATQITAEGVELPDRHIEARTVLWAAGVAASPLARALNSPIGRAGRVKVNEHLQLPEDPRVFVVGDLAEAESRGRPVPGVAPAAMQGGKHAGKSIARILRDKPVKPFRFKDKGDLATIGRARAVADLRIARLSGRTAWWLWLLVHIAFLIGFRSRLFVLLGWCWSYLSHHRGARLITGPLELPIDCQEARERGAA
jgi:NADH dehydrogenase